MSKIARFVGNLKAFASGATALNRTLFADAPNQSDILTDNINADFLAGWENGLDPVNGFPPQEYFNAVGFVATQLSAYLHQTGIAEWAPLQEYYIGNLTNVSGVIYKSLTEPNIGNDPTSSPTEWEDIIAASLVPPGMISLWSGSIATIPSGWNLCDGSNGTPDLTDRFVIHADADAAGTHNVGDTLTGTGAADGHTLVEAEIPAHVHSGAFTGGNLVGGGASDPGTTPTNTGSTGGDGSHSHVITDYKPKSYALAYVMKL